MTKHRRLRNPVLKMLAFRSESVERCQELTKSMLSGLKLGLRNALQTLLPKGTLNI